MSPQPFVFVAMPFGSKLKNVYEFGIKPVCEALGALCERVDEQIYKEPISQRIHQQIQAADLVIGEITEPNANVYYEIGYSKGQGKNVVLLAENAEKIPFDLAGERHLIYGGEIARLKELLDPTVRFLLREGDSSPCPIPIEGSWSGNILAQNPDPVANSVALTVDLVWSGSINGKGTMEVPGYGPIPLRFSGNFLHERFLLMTYRGTDPGIMQFGATVLRLNAASNRIQGHYVGYGAITDALVYGAISLTRAK